MARAVTGPRRRPATSLGPGVIRTVAARSRSAFKNDPGHVLDRKCLYLVANHETNGPCVAARVRARNRLAGLHYKRIRREDGREQKNEKHPHSEHLRRKFYLDFCDFSDGPPLCTPDRKTGFLTSECDERAVRREKDAVFSFGHAQQQAVERITVRLRSLKAGQDMFVGYR